MDIDLDGNQILDLINDGIYIVDRSRKIIFWNKAAERISGYSKEDVEGTHCYDNILNHVNSEGTQLCFVGCPLQATINDSSPRDAEVFLHHKDGHRVPVWVRTSPYYDESGDCVGAIEFFSDISNKWQYEEHIKELKKLAMIDSLTEVANRYYLTQHVESSFEEMKRYKSPFGILFFDIDDFKSFNDSYGHDVGDKVLKLVSRTVSRNLRPFDLFGRWGGEEFLAIIRNCDAQGVLQIAERFKNLIGHSQLRMGNTKLGITVSVGATIVHEGDTPGSIIKRADELMYKSKEQGKNQVTSDLES